MLEFGERKSDHSASEDGIPLLLARASRMALQGKEITLHSEQVVTVFAHVIVVFPLTEFQHVHIGEGKNTSLFPSISRNPNS